MPPKLLMNHLLALGLDSLVRRANETAAEGMGRNGRGKPASIHDAWLTALVSVDATVWWDEERELRDFSGHLEQWRRPVPHIPQTASGRKTRCPS